MWLPPPFLVNTVNRYFYYIRGNRIHHILFAYSSCRVSNQGTTLRASDLHNARVTNLNPFIKPKVIGDFRCNPLPALGCAQNCGVPNLKNTPYKYHNSPVPGPLFTNAKTSYRQISWSLEAARLAWIMIVSLWNLTGILAALLPGCLSNLGAIRKD